MSVSVFERVRTSLCSSVRVWRPGFTAHRLRKNICASGRADEEAVQAHLQVLDSALQKAADHTLGLCEVCHDYVEPSRLEMDYTACVCLEHLAAEERRRLESDLELSTKVAAGSPPSASAQHSGLELAAFSQPARIVGGDYFDFLHFRDKPMAWSSPMSWTKAWPPVC